MITLILAGLMGSFGYLTYYYRGKCRDAKFEAFVLRMELQERTETYLLAANQLAGHELDKVMLPAPQQTRIFGNAKTEDLIANWLEKGWSPLGDDLTDTENSRQIAARIRRGEYLDELVSSENQQSVCGDAG